MKDDRIGLIKGDITRFMADAIVNAANSSLMGGGGVDGAIHRAAGPELLDECITVGGCPTGEARITKGYRLPARYVIHTVGPVYGKDPKKAENLLASCYQKSLRLAAENDCKTIAFPNISTGVYGYPKEEAALVAIRTVRRFLAENASPSRVTFVCFDEENYLLYQKHMTENSGCD